MTFKFLNIALPSLIMGASCYIGATNAALIDTNNGTFIDTSTNLEWLDITDANSYTYGDLQIALQDGGALEDWTLSDEETFDVIIEQAFRNVSGIMYDGYSLYEYTFNMEDKCNNNSAPFIPSSCSTDWNQWYANLGIMGSIHESEYNLIQIENILTLPLVTSANSFNATTIKLWHNGDTNQIKRVTNSTYDNDTIYQYGLFKAATVVPEPSTLAVFALGLCGLAARRFKK
jgi:hypothetical protein